MTNPKRTLAAVTAAGQNVAGVHVREITLGIAAVLERINSPLVRRMQTAEELTLRDMLPSMYVMTRPAVESEYLLAEGDGALMAAAVGWGDALTTADGLAIAMACSDAAKRLAQTSTTGAPDRGTEGNGASQAMAG